MTEDRTLDAPHVAAVVIGATVGVGIFFTPSTLARAVPTPGWILGIWTLGGMAAIAGALVLADLGTRWPRAGGLYVFLREGFGGRAGDAMSFLFGWVSLLVIQPCAMAIVAVVLVEHVLVLTGPVPSVLRSAGACASIALFAAANLVGLRTGGRIQVILSVVKIVGLGLIVAIGLGWGHWGRMASAGPSPEVHSPGDVPSWLVFGLIPVLFTYGGSYHATFIAGSVRNPDRALPRGILVGVGAVVVTYLGANLAYLLLLGRDGLAATTTPATDAIRVALGSVAGKVVAAAIVVSAAGYLNTVILGFPFVLYAMAHDGAFFARAGQLAPRTGRPAFAIAAQGSLACAAVIVGSSRVDVLLTGIAFADATFQSALAVVGLRGRGRRIYAAPAAAAWIFLTVELGVALGCLLRAPGPSAYGAAVLAAGVVVWLVWRRT